LEIGVDVLGSEGIVGVADEENPMLLPLQAHRIAIEIRANEIITP